MDLKIRKKRTLNKRETAKSIKTKLKKVTKRAPKNDSTPVLHSMAETKYEGFTEALGVLEDYMEENKEVVETLRTLIAEYNASLAEFVHTLREESKGTGPKKRTLGPFKVTRIISTEYDIDKLGQHVPVEQLVESGAVEVVTKYKVDGSTLLDLVGSLIPPKVFNEIISEVEKTPRVSQPYKPKVL